MLAPGDPAPWFEGRSSALPKLVFDSLAGRYVVLSFIGSSAFAASGQLIEQVEREHAHFDVLNACFCGVSVDPEDEKQGRLRQKFPGIMYFWDFDRSVSRLYGAAGANGQYFVHSLLLDPNLRVLAAIPFQDDNRDHVARLLQLLAQFPQTTALNHFAPVLTLAHVLEPHICNQLIDMYHRDGGQELGILREVNGQTVRVHDHEFKRRRDCTVTDPAMLATLDDRLRRRVFPEIKKAFQFKATQIERFVVGCYEASSGGFFRAHRDDQTRGSAHRRFAISIGLNATAYEGGDLRFPEFGSRTYRAPTGGAIIFSCTLAHEVRPVRRGTRYAFLPFVYDDQDARARDANRQFLAENVRASAPEPVPSPSHTGS
jgi:peroxiredoxin